jgi:hypothetical protein
MAHAHPHAHPHTRPTAPFRSDLITHYDSCAPLNSARSARAPIRDIKTRGPIVGYWDLASGPRSTRLDYVLFLTDRRPHLQPSIDGSRTSAHLTVQSELFSHITEMVSARCKRKLALINLTILFISHIRYNISYGSTN